MPQFFPFSAEQHCLSRSVPSANFTVEIPSALSRITSSLERRTWPNSDPSQHSPHERHSSSSTALFLTRSTQRAASATFALLQHHLRSDRGDRRAVHHLLDLTPAAAPDPDHPAQAVP